MTTAKLLTLEEEWPRVVAGIEKTQRILEGCRESHYTPGESMAVYSTVYNLCTQRQTPDYAGKLYDAYEEAIIGYCRSTVLPSLSDNLGEFLLRDFVRRWDNHKLLVRCLVRFFLYIDRFYVGRVNKPDLRTAGLSVFLRLVHEAVRERVADVVVDLMLREREGEPIDRALLKKVMEEFVEVGPEENMYKELEVRVISAAGNYYCRKSSEWILVDSCPEYMRRAEECLRREKDRAESYLQPSTEKMLLEKTRHEVLAVHLNSFLEKEDSGCLALLRMGRTEDLSRMYRLLVDVPQGLEPVAAFFKKHVIEEGLSLVAQTEEEAASKKEKRATGSASHEIVFVRKVIELHDKYFGYVNDCFRNHTLLVKAGKVAFEALCNKPICGTPAADILVNFLENVLRKGGGERLSDDAMETTLDKLVTLTTYLEDKDMFAEFYRKRLARRLLNDRSAADEHERSMVAKLKQRYGGQLTSKMEGMLTDLTLAKDKQAAFDEFLLQGGSRRQINMDFSVSVLSTGFWPTYKPWGVNLPEEMVKAVEIFQNHYQTASPSRRLSWIYSLGSATIVGKFESRRIELVVNTYQACLLLLFNDSDRLSCGEMVSQLNLPDEDVRRLLHSLSCAKYKILKKSPDSRTIAASDVFEFNAGFTDKLKKIKIPVLPVEERKKVEEEVNRNRRYVIAAAIVRIMKRRKVLEYPLLVSECVAQLSRSFKPDMKVIKKQVESLVERDYLERDAESSNTFKYVA